jgi:dUTP pyrophosphatase
MHIKIINQSAHPLPSYETALSAGMDLRASIAQSISIAPAERVLIATGLFIELPEGYEAQVRPRSGLALKHGITVLNSPGTIDADYRGEIKVLLINHGSDSFTVNDGDRIAQMIVSAHSRVEWEQVQVLSTTIRGEGGYGHTGK